MDNLPIILTDEQKGILKGMQLLQEFLLDAMYFYKHDTLTVKDIKELSIFCYTQQKKKIERDLLK